MELELSNLLGESKGDYSNQIKDFKRNLENQKNKIEQLEDDFSRKSLYGEKESQNQGLLDKGEKISVQNKNLVEARNNMISCEIDAIDAQRELHRQTGVMEKGINRMKEVWGELSISNKFVSLISQRRLRQKAVLYVVMLLVALAFLFIIYWNLIR